MIKPTPEDHPANCPSVSTSGGWGGSLGGTPQLTHPTSCDPPAVGEGHLGVDQARQTMLNSLTEASPTFKNLTKHENLYLLMQCHDWEATDAL